MIAHFVKWRSMDYPDIKFSIVTVSNIDTTIQLLQEESKSPVEILEIRPLEKNIVYGMRVNLLS